MKGKVFLDSGEMIELEFHFECLPADSAHGYPTTSYIFYPEERVDFDDNGIRLQAVDASDMIITGRLHDQLLKIVEDSY